MLYACTSKWVRPAGARGGVGGNAAAKDVFTALCDRGRVRSMAQRSWKLGKANTSHSGFHQVRALGPRGATVPLLQWSGVDPQTTSYCLLTDPKVLLCSISVSSPYHLTLKAEAVLCTDTPEYILLAPLLALARRNIAQI